MSGMYFESYGVVDNRGISVGPEDGDLFRK